LAEHFESIFSRLAIDLLKSPALLTSDWEIWFTIGMMFSIEEIVFPELVIPPQCVHMLDGTRVGIDITFYPSLILPALQLSADAFLGDLAGGRVGAAYARTSTGFRAGQGLEEFRAFVDRYPALKVHTSQQPGGPVGTVKMTILSPNSSLSFTLVFVQEEEEWKLDRFTVP
jgi:hypothetical protein